MDDSRFMTPIRYRIENMLPELVKAYAPAKPNVLDLGCGRGMYSQLFIHFPSFSYIGIDIKERPDWKGFASPSIKHLVADGTKTPFKDNQFNFAIAIASLEHIKDEQAAVAELYRTVQPGSHVIIMVPTKPYWLFQLGRHCYHHNSKKQLYALVKKQDFDIIEYEKVGGIFSFLFTWFDIWLSQAILLPFWLARKLLKNPLTADEMETIRKRSVHWYMNFHWSRNVYHSFLEIIDAVDRLIPVLPNHHSIVLRKK